MSALFKQTDKGVLKYRMPDIAEGHMYLAMFDKINTNADVLRIMSGIMKNMVELIQYQELGYVTYQEVLTDKENMTAAISEIAKEIYDDILGMLIKKNSSLMP